MQATVRVVLADDHPLVRTGLRAALAVEEDILSVGEATDGYEAQRLARELQPHVLVLDVSMPGPPAVDTVAYVREHCPGTRILILSAYHNPTLIRGMMAAGVDCYLLKDEPNEVVLRAIRAVVSGNTWVSRPIMEALLEPKDHGQVETALPVLTDQELAVLRLMVAGQIDVAIGHALHISERTVRRHLRNIYDKLSVDTRVEAAARAARLGLVEVQQSAPDSSP